MAADLNIRITGGAGQGVHTVGAIISRMAVLWGYHFHATQDYMSRIRGGRNSYSVRIGSDPVRAGRDEADILLVLPPIIFRTFFRGFRRAGSLWRTSPPRLRRFWRRRSSRWPFPQAVPFWRTWRERASSPAPWGFRSISAPLLAVDFKGDVLEKNRKALALGEEWARERLGETFRLSRAPSSPRVVMSGNEALALGAIAGGCKFAAGYPMTPGTGILSVLADNGPAVGLVFEQSEDEIAALNMAIGASYAGARAMVATSGGGFALMVEALSLPGCGNPGRYRARERPGPATGCPRGRNRENSIRLPRGTGSSPGWFSPPKAPRRRRSTWPSMRWTWRRRTRCRSSFSPTSTWRTRSTTWTPRNSTSKGPCGGIWPGDGSSPRGEQKVPPVRGHRGRRFPVRGAGRAGGHRRGRSDEHTEDGHPRRITSPDPDGGEAAAEGEGAGERDAPAAGSGPPRGTPC